MKENEHSEESHLIEHGIRPTAVRILVWRKICHKRQTFTLNDVEDMLPEMDKSSIFRALRLFTEQQLLHEINDGSGFCKYCLCRCEAHGHLNHVHFNCVKCGKTYCLENEIIPRVGLPEGFEMQEAEYVVKGICANCKK